MRKTFHIDDSTVLQISWYKERTRKFNLMYRGRFDWMINLGKIKIYMEKLCFSKNSNI